MTNRKLDRSKDFGRVVPPWVADNCDRAAHYEQDGKLFDQHGIEIVPGQKRESLPETVAKTETEAGLLSIGDILANPDAVAFPTLRKRAREILGEACPSGKQAILDALAAARKGYEERVARRRSTAPESAEDDGDTQEPPPPTLPNPSPTVNGIDLAAWGRGRIDRLFAEVQRAIRTHYSKQVTERRDAVEFLIEQGVITAAEARTDV